MRISLFTLPLLASGLAAQTTITMTAATPISVMTNEAGNVTFDTVAANTPIGSWPDNVFMSTSQNPSGKFLHASTSVYPGVPNAGGIAMLYFLHANCRGVAGDFAGSSSSPAQAGATLGGNSVLATFAAAPGTAGNIRISLLANPGTNGTAEASVDIGNDGSVEFTSTSTGVVVIPYTFGASGQVVVRVDNECGVPGVGLGTFNSAYSEVSLGFWPDLTATCNITSYGQGCFGVAATGSEQVSGTTRTIDIDATGCFPNDPVLVMTGTLQLSLPLFLGCSLYCNAESLGVVTADGAGDATASFNIPATATGLTHVQLLPLTVQGGALVLRSSNGVRIDCF